ncbi:MAG: Fe-S cluster protector protein [Chloroflexi bacterium]|nr:Fe-S cluster protector protein [Chloroflexota bacterium]
MAEERLVVCSRCGEDKPGLAAPPLSGAIGKQVFEEVCQDCWDAWFEQSVNVINHYELTPALPEHRRQLYEIMKEYLNL